MKVSYFVLLYGGKASSFGSTAKGAASGETVSQCMPFCHLDFGSDVSAGVLLRAPGAAVYVLQCVQYAAQAGGHCGQAQIAGGVCLCSLWARIFAHISHIFAYN